MLTTKAAYTRTTVHALDIWTGTPHPFTIEHNAGRIRAIRYDTGATVPRASEQFTEAAEAFAIDREADQRADSDVPPRFHRCY